MMKIVFFTMAIIKNVTRDDGDADDDDDGS